ncbi:MAG: sporulation integral membrane protein YtvI [Candidatus Limivicinus sp.]
MQQRAGKILRALIYFGAAVGGIWLAASYILPWTAPFLLAFSVAALLERPVRALVKKGWRRSAASGLLTVGVLGLIIWLAVALTLRGISAATGFAKEVPGLMKSAAATISGIEERAVAYAASAPEGVSEYLRLALEAIGNFIYALPSRISERLLDFMAKAAQSSPDVLLFIVTAGIGTYFISASFPGITSFLKAQLPEGFRRRWEGVGHDLKLSFGGFIRAQLILMAMTFFELLLSFLLLDIEEAPAAAALTALIDALPVFGTGTVLVPWGIYSLLVGQIQRGLGLLITWGIVNLVRSCAQAKLLGDEIGLDPVASLLAIYMGWRVCGVLGMLLFPILFVTLKQLNDRGLINLWKTE